MGRECDTARRTPGPPGDPNPLNTAIKLRSGPARTGFPAGERTSDRFHQPHRLSGRRHEPRAARFDVSDDLPPHARLPEFHEMRPHAFHGGLPRFAVEEGGDVVRREVAVPNKSYGPPVSQVYFWYVPANVAGRWRWQLPVAGKAAGYEAKLGQLFQEVDGEILIDGGTATVRDL